MPPTERVPLKISPLPGITNVWVGLLPRSPPPTPLLDPKCCETPLPVSDKERADSSICVAPRSPLIQDQRAMRSSAHELEGGLAELHAGLEVIKESECQVRVARRLVIHHPLAPHKVTGLHAWKCLWRR